MVGVAANACIRFRRIKYLYQWYAGTITKTFMFLPVNAKMHILSEVQDDALIKGKN